MCLFVCLFVCLLDYYLVIEGDATKNRSLFIEMPASSLREDILRIGCPGGI